MQNCPRQLAMQSCVLCSFVRWGSSNQTEKKKKEKKNIFRIPRMVKYYLTYIKLFRPIQSIIQIVYTYSIYHPDCLYLFNLSSRLFRPIQSIIQIVYTSCSIYHPDCLYLLFNLSSRLFRPPVQSIIQIV